MHLQICSVHFRIHIHSAIFYNRPLVLGHIFCDLLICSHLNMADDDQNGIFFARCVRATHAKWMLPQMIALLQYFRLDWMVYGRVSGASECVRVRASCNVLSQIFRTEIQINYVRQTTYGVKARLCASLCLFILPIVIQRSKYVTCQSQ